MKFRWIWFVGGLVCQGALLACVAQETPGLISSPAPQGTGGSVDPLAVAITNTIHFSTPDGQDALIEPGSYRVESSGKDRLRMTTADGKTTTIIQAAAVTHQAKLTQATASTVPDGDNPGVVHVVLVQPDGTALTAAGSPSGVQGRGGIPAVSSLTLKPNLVSVAICSKSDTTTSPPYPFIYALTSTGILKWYRHDDPWNGGARWTGPRDVLSPLQGVQMMFSTPYADTGEMYTIAFDGRVRWYAEAHTPQSASFVPLAREPGYNGGWAGPSILPGNMAGYKQVFAGNSYVKQPGIRVTTLYGITPQGELHWFSYSGAINGGTDPRYWVGPKTVGTGWQHFKHVFSIGAGIIYAVDYSGTVSWYLHEGVFDGTSRWLGPKVVYSGWINFQSMFSPGLGIVYGITNTGDLLWFRHRGWETGVSASQDVCAWAGPYKVGNGWQEFPFVFANLPVGPYN